MPSPTSLQRKYADPRVNRNALIARRNAILHKVRELMFRIMSGKLMATANVLKKVKSLKKQASNLNAQQKRNATRMPNYARQQRAQTTIARHFRGGRARALHLNPNSPREQSRIMRMLTRNTPWTTTREKKAYGSAIRTSLPYGPQRQNVESRARAALCKAMGMGACGN